MGEENPKKNIAVTVDKSHLVTIGERLYTEKTSFIRELVNNAYDADATEVFVAISPQEIRIRDNGSGMSEAGLGQYFTIGSSFKKQEDTSPRFGRKRIGEFGIGKFAALAVAERFIIETQRDEFHGCLEFDKRQWTQREDWNVELDILPSDPARGNGTMITLVAPSVLFASGKVRRYLAERTPIHLPHFAVFLNNERVTDDVVAGMQLPIHTVTPYGVVEGTIVIVPPERRLAQAGIGVTVKGVLIRHEALRLDTSRRYGATRISGRVAADFLPVTSGRDDFIRDAPEFLAFLDVMQKEMKHALSLLREEGDRKADLEASRVLKDALGKIGRAVRSRQNLFPGAVVPFGVASETAPDGTGYEISSAEFIQSRDQLEPDVIEHLRAVAEKNPNRRQQGILGKKSVIRTLKIGRMDIAVRLEHLGTDDESLVSGGVIYVNLDHPLYKTYRGNDLLLTLHIARVITKELALQTGVTDPQEAFALQADLLTDALQGHRIA